MGFLPQLMRATRTAGHRRKGASGTTRSRAAKAPTRRSTSSRASARADARIPDPGHRGLSQCLERDHQGRREVQRARPLHRLHRLRVDLEHRRQQPAPQRHLPRRQGEGRPGRALHHAAAGQRRTRRTCGSGWQAYEEKTGGDVLAIAHNGNLSQRHHVPGHRAFTGKPLDKQLRRRRAPVGAALRDDTDQGRRRDPSLPVAQRRVRRLRDVGQGQPRRCVPKKPGCSSTNTRARR